MVKRQAAGGSFADYSVPYTEGPEATYLVTPHMVRTVQLIFFTPADPMPRSHSPSL